VEVQTQPVPVLNISASNTMICQGDSVTIQVSGASSYSWQDPNLSGSTVLVKPTQHTAFSVTGTNAQGCSSSIQQIVLVNASPTVALSANPATICVGGTTTLTASGAHTYVWSDQNTGNMNMV